MPAKTSEQVAAEVAGALVRAKPLKRGESYTQEDIKQAMRRHNAPRWVDSWEVERSLQRQGHRSR